MSDYIRIKRLESELHALTEVAKTLSSPLDLPDLLNAVLEKISNVLEPAEAGAIMLWDQSAGLFRAEAAFGFDLQVLKKIGLRSGEAITGKVFDSGVPLLLISRDEVAQAMADMREANLVAFYQAAKSDALPSCSLAVLLQVGVVKFGVLVLQTFKRPEKFTRNDLNFIQSIADLIALAIDRSRLEAKADAIRETRQADRLRSSSQLEDNFGTSFAGKYDSHFCPNQGSPHDNLCALTNAIARTYASTLKPDALSYRRSKGLQDYDERMAILIQPVQGEKFGKYFLPHGAGVAFSRNIYRWSPEIRREDGFVRLVWGLGTRAVERVGNDYTRLVALSHPLLQPDDSCQAIQHYSQKNVDLIDLEANAFKTLPVHQVLAPNYPSLRYIVQLLEDGFLVTPRSRVPASDINRLSITFQELLRRTPFASVLHQTLRLLENHYHATVDLEFTVQVPNPMAIQPEVQIT